MIPIHLSIAGFLSYRDPAELDFRTFELACISGANGAGKSSLLDAITWALFGQARKRDESLINTQSNGAEVRFIFSYENNYYRIQRALPRGKTSTLDFQILQVPQSLDGPIDELGIWKTLNESTQRATQAKIEDTLCLDYETFVNAAFFLQGKADQFTQQRSGDRKRILSSILGLETWEVYRQQAAEKRKLAEAEIDNIEGRLTEIQAELAEEETRKANLARLEKQLALLSKTRQAQEETLDSIRRITAALVEQKKLVEALRRQLEAASAKLGENEQRLAARRQESQAFVDILAREAGIRAAYTAWQQARIDLQRWDGIAAQFREQEKRRQGPLDEINDARSRLSEQLRALQDQKAVVEGVLSEREALLQQLEKTEQDRRLVETELSRRAQLDLELQNTRQRQSDARAENQALKPQMDELKKRISTLEETEGASCPLCGQPLSPQDRKKLIAELKAGGKEMGDRHRANQKLLQELEKTVHDLEEQITSLAEAEGVLRQYNRTVDQIHGRLGEIEKWKMDWETQDAPRLRDIERQLAEEGFAPEARARLAEIDAELKAIGYDAAAHDAVRKAELDGRPAEDDLRSLEKAQAALAPLQREIASLEEQIGTQKSEVDRQQQEYSRAAESLAASQAQAPDEYAAERQLYTLQEQENRLRLEVGAAQQKVLVLGDLKARRKELVARRDEFAHRVAQYKQLERAFGKDGVPALLIEQALPQIETKANEILDRLSASSMSVHFETTAPYKDKKREDLKETLEIQISDEAGVRDYEMYSGGESFRVDFAIRLALSEVLAQRAGARLQTLVIDEGFGSQDTLGRQRMVEAINMVRQEFSKILVITHIDELKDAFPNRIEVEKTARGSTVRVI